MGLPASAPPYIPNNPDPDSALAWPPGEESSRGLIEPRSGERLKRVIYIMALDPRGKFGSLEEQVLTLARAFRDRGSLFVPVFMRPLDEESAAQYARENLLHESMDLTRFRLSETLRLFRLVRRLRIEVVHWNFYGVLSNPNVWLMTTLAPGVEHYYTDHISRSSQGNTPARRRRLKTAVKGILTGRYRKILCISRFVCEQWNDLTTVKPQLVECFINTERFRPDAASRRKVREEMGVNDEFVVVAVAHLIKEKGIDVAIRALAMLPGKVRLWVIGQGPEEGALRSLAAELGLSPRVRFLGPQRFVQPFLQAADCAICPSVWAEAVGLVNLEATACGLPVVASRIGGIPEFIGDGLNGYLFTAGDDGELAACLTRLIQDEAGRQALGERARSFAVQHHSASRLLDEHLNLYRVGAERVSSRPLDRPGTDPARRTSDDR